jgi:hypothetical protein
MAAHDLWLVFALVFFLIAAFRGFLLTPAQPFYASIHTGWLGAALVTCYFLIR